MKEKLSFFSIVANGNNVLLATNLENGLTLIGVSKVDAQSEAISVYK